MRNLRDETIWNESRSIRLSRVLVVLFFIALIACDAGGWWLVQFVRENWGVHHDPAEGYVLLACLYLCSVPGYWLLYDLNRLLRNIQAAQVFLPVNVKLLRQISWCCFAACAICLCGVAAWPSLFVVATAAGFVGLIVRVVKNVFEQAIRMKDELDFTV